jgi:hypothetical protein
VLEVERAEAGRLEDLQGVQVDGAAAGLERDVFKGMELEGSEK